VPLSQRRRSLFEIQSHAFGVEPSACLSHAERGHEYESRPDAIAFSPRHISGGRALIKRVMASEGCGFTPEAEACRGHRPPTSRGKQKQWRDANTERHVPPRNVCGCARLASLVFRLPSSRHASDDVIALHVAVFGVGRKAAKVCKPLVAGGRLACGGGKECCRCCNHLAKCTVKSQENTFQGSEAKSAKSAAEAVSIKH
jgi:hypothetical protein